VVETDLHLHHVQNQPSAPSLIRLPHYERLDLLVYEPERVTYRVRALGLIVLCPSREGHRGWLGRWRRRLDRINRLGGPILRDPVRGDALNLMTY
jgi:hypothetical protein